jgi:hypothetical protein
MLENITDTDGTHDCLFRCGSFWTASALRQWQTLEGAYPTFPLTASVCDPCPGTVLALGSAYVSLRMLTVRKATS